MGLKDMFFGGSGRKTKVEKLTKRITNQFAQSPDRYGGMEDLFKLAAQNWDKAQKHPEGSSERAELETQSDDAYVGLLRRFSMNASKSIDDEEEKGWLYNRLSAVGKPLLPALKRFACEAEGIAWPLRIVEDVANESEEWEILDAVIAVHPPEYERDSSAKLQMLTHVKEIDDSRVRGILTTYLGDPDEGVRFFCIDALIENAEQEALPDLLDQLEKAGDSVRLRTRILDGLADLGWDVSEFAAIVRKTIGDEHGFDGKVLSRR